MLPAEIYIGNTTAAIFICAFPLSQSNLAAIFHVWFFGKENPVLFYNEYILFPIKNQW